ncbi:MAG: M3 family peptidase, partial [Cyanobium sp.]
MTLTLEPPALLAGEGLPRFEAITPDQIETHIPELLSQLEAERHTLEARFTAALEEGRPLGWHEVMDPLHRLGERLRWSWGVVGHLNGVCNSPELRQAHASQQAAVVAFGQRCGQSRVIHAVLRALEARGGW